MTLYAIGFFVIIGGKGTQDNVHPPTLNAIPDAPIQKLPSALRTNNDVKNNGNNDEQSNADGLKPVTVGWAVTITGCGSDPISEGAAVLKHAVHLTSIHGNTGGKYDYKMYAIYHPQGEVCALTLKDLGFELVRRETPVDVKDIEGKFLREHIVRILQ